MTLIAPQGRKIRFIILDFWFTVATQSSMFERYFDVGEVRVSMLEPKFQLRNLEFLQHRNFNMEIQNFNIESFDVGAFLSGIDQNYTLYENPSGMPS